MVEIKHKQRVSLLVNQNFVTVMFCSDVLRLWFKNVKVCVKFDHLLFEVVQKMISERLIISQVPSSSTVMIRPAVSFTRKVNPFRMPKLVAHKSQVTLTSETESQKSYHFM